MGKSSQQPPGTHRGSGKLRIGDHWNAITIIALSQSNPLKAVAEFVENSIDARAKNILIVRGKERGQPYLRITDDGEGIVRDENGSPDFRYVATHICDSIKRRMKEQGQQGIQGEFGIGLLSFWTVGDELTLTAAGADGKSYEMRMVKGDPNYTVIQKRRLLPQQGTQLTVRPLLPGIRHFSGEKLQWYLASELRDRIRTSGVQIRIIDRQAQAEYQVEPRQFSGRLLHQVPAPTTPRGEVYVELYLAEPSAENQIGLFRSGTRVLANLREIDELNRPPWDSEYLQGILDAPFLNLTPGSRLGIIRDGALADFCQALGPVEASLMDILQEQKKAEEEQTNRQTLRSIQKAFREALLALPEDEYDWFNIHGGEGRARRRPGRTEPGAPLKDGDLDELPGSVASCEAVQKEFFEHPGPLFSVRVSPASFIVPVGQSKNLRAVPRDRSRRLVEEDLSFTWEVVEGAGTLANPDGEIVTYTAPGEPCLAKIRVTATQRDVVCSGEGLATVTDSLLPEKKETREQQGLPGYTFRKAPGELWRSRYDLDKNVIVINNGHRDFVYASRSSAMKLRYIARLFVKELVLRNFPGQPAGELLERMVELSLYTEEHLK